MKNIIYVYSLLVCIQSAHAFDGIKAFRAGPCNLTDTGCFPDNGKNYVDSPEALKPYCVRQIDWAQQCNKSSVDEKINSKEVPFNERKLGLDYRICSLPVQISRIDNLSETLSIDYVLDYQSMSSVGVDSRTADAIANVMMHTSPLYWWARHESNMTKTQEKNLQEMPACPGANPRAAPSSVSGD